MKFYNVFLSRFFLVGLFLINSSLETFAKDLGVVGSIFEIKEEDLLEMMMLKMLILEKQGEFTKFEEMFKKIAVEKISEPKPVLGIKKAKELRSFLVDLSIINPEDILDHEGKLIASRGTKVNPLDHINYSKELIFIDSNDKAQVNWLKALEIKPRKIILISGRPIDLEKSLDEEIYFDQAGFLSSRFNISSVPAVVVQEGKFMRVTEVKIDG